MGLFCPFKESHGVKQDHEPSWQMVQLGEEKLEELKAPRMSHM